MSRARDLADLGGSADAGGITGKNLIINGGFQCWQRGVSVGDGSTVLNEEFLADRWRCDDGVGGNMIISQQSFTTGQTDVPNNPKFYHRLDFPTTAPSDNGTVEQRIEGVSTAAGETTTLSFWAKGTMSSSISINIVQYFGTGGSPSTTVDTSVTTFSLTSSWVKHTVNINVASISGKTIGSDENHYLSVKFLTGTNTGQFDLAQVQLELGEQATPFEHRSYGDELARCQRFFQRFQVPQWYYNTLGATSIYHTERLAVEMRANGTLSVNSSLRYWSGGSDAPLTPTLTGYGDRVRIQGLSLTNANGFVDGIIDLDAEL